ncbi:MAG: hypothetical protein AB1649_20580 [Chloroflexota bacterium]
MMIENLARNWWLVVLRGVLAILFGLAAVLWPALTLFVLVVMFGILHFSKLVEQPRLRLPSTRMTRIYAKNSYLLRPMQKAGQKRWRGGIRPHAHRFCHLPECRLISYKNSRLSWLPRNSH